jgi:hypothetical protein
MRTGLRIAVVLLALAAILLALLVARVPSPQAPSSPVQEQEARSEPPPAPPEPTQPEPPADQPVEVSTPAVDEQPEETKEAGGLSIWGTVANTRGQTVEGASIGVRIDLPHTTGEGVNGAKTDATGQYEMTGLVPETYSITASHSEHITKAWKVVVSRTGSRRIDITLNEGGSIEGVVTRQGEPWQETPVSATAYLEGQQYDRKTETDQDGFYRFTTIPEGEVMVHAAYQDRLVRVEEGKVARLDITWRTGDAEIYGSVTSNGIPLLEGDASLIQITSTGKQIHGGTDIKAGQFQYGQLAGGVYLLTVSGERPDVSDPRLSHARKAVKVVVDENEVVRRDVDLMSGTLVVGTVFGIEEGERLHVEVLLGDVGVKRIDKAFVGGWDGHRLTRARIRGGDQYRFTGGLERGTYTIVAYEYSGGDVDGTSRFVTRRLDIPADGPPEMRVDLTIP